MKTGTRAVHWQRYPVIKQQSHSKDRLVGRPAQSQEPVALLSEEVMPAEKGEFYSYSSQFCRDRPLYFLMKCKANKSRPLTIDIGHIVQELDLTFVFGKQTILCSPNSGPSLELLRSVAPNLQDLHQSKIRATTLTEDFFYDLHRGKKKSLLIKTVEAQLASGGAKSSAVLSPGLILSVKTSSGKYGLILVKEVSAFSCKVDACHILL